jgi:hypothetical protein
MIGFDSQLRGDQRQMDEEAETKSLEKKELYEMVAKTWFIPPYQSRGVTREYLLKVHRDQVYRLTNGEIKHFEVELEPHHHHKAQGMGHSVLIRKLNILLNLTGRKPLGFTEHDIPDQAWLHRIARHIDPTSLTEFFNCPIVREPMPNSNSKAISCIHHGRVAAAKWFMRHDQVNSNRRYWDSLHTVSNLYRALLNKDLAIECMQKELTEHQQERAIMGNNLDDMISKASLTYTAILNPTIKPEAVIAGSADITTDMRQELTRNSKL